ncbi:hypothetical protein DL768_000423 [Monosporascus sp. mg162]|nr:hypothetical protein DL768_000423 [Monosporascus sp. mg162]
MTTTARDPRRRTYGYWYGPPVAPGFALSRCEPADIPGMVDVYISAFQDGDYVYWRAPTPKMRAWNGERFVRRFADPAESHPRSSTRRPGGSSRTREQQPSHTNNDPGIDKAQQQCQTTDTSSASSQVHLRGGCLSESGDPDFVYYLGTSAPRPAPPVARPTRAGFPPSYRRRETADPPPPYQTPSRPPSYKSKR